MSGGEQFAALGLMGNPFAADALPDFYFVGGQRRFLLQQALHGLYIAGSVVLLCGERGAGKSHLLAALRGELQGLVDCCAITASVLMDGTEIRRRLAELYRLSPDVAQSNESLVDALSRRAPADSEPMPVALLVDDAHELAVQTLAELQQLIGVASGRIRLLLAGEPTLVAAWQQLPIAAAELFELQPLDLQETADYLQTRLQAAGWRGVLPLSEEQIERLHRTSGGCIGRLNELAPAALVAGEAESGASRSIARRLPWRWVGGAAAVLLLAGIVVSMVGHEEPPSVEAPSDGERTTVALSLPAVAPSSAVPVVEEVSTQHRVAVPAPLPDATLAQASGEQAASEVAPAPAPASTPTTAQPVAQPLPAPVVAKPSKPVQPASAAKPVVAKPKPVEPAPVGQVAYRFDERKLLAMSAQGYLLQLMAVESQAKLESFLKANAAGVPTLRYEAIRGGKRLLVLVAGPYADRAATMAAVSKLPASIRESKPWPRTVASVQADIRAAHGGR